MSAMDFSCKTSPKTSVSLSVRSYVLRRLSKGQPSCVAVMGREILAASDNSLAVSVLMGLISFFIRFPAVRGRAFCVRA